MYLSVPFYTLAVLTGKMKGRGIEIGGLTTEVDEGTTGHEGSEEYRRIFRVIRGKIRFYTLVGFPNSDLPTYFFYTTRICYLMISRNFFLFLSVAPTWTSCDTSHFIRSVSCLWRIRVSMYLRFLQLRIFVSYLTTNGSWCRGPIPLYNLFTMFKNQSTLLFQVF